MTTKEKRAIHQYSEESLQSALNDVREGSSIRGASKKYGVPRATIQDRIHGRIAEGPRAMGPQTILTNDEEKLLVKWCHDLSKCGFPLKIDDLLNTVQAIIKEDGRTTPFVNGRPGRKWYKLFLKRHPDLVLREAEGISKGRAVITEESIRKWFDELKNFLSQENALDILDDPSRIFNGDETSFCLCPKTGKVLAPKGYRNVYSIQRGNEKETVTVLLVFSASGKTVHPMVVFPYVRPPKEVVNSIPENWYLGKSETGWMVSETFYEYVANGVHSWLNEHNVQRPILLFIDGHKSHMTMQLSEFCQENGIILYALPPNTTHIMQPADVSVFKPLKSEWKKTVREWQWKLENNNKVVSKTTFCPLLHMVLTSINITDTIKNGFRKCGLYPFNPDNVDYTKCVKNQLEILTEAEQRDNETFKESDFDIAIKVIDCISPNLRERGISSDIIVEEIGALKKIDKNTNLGAVSSVAFQPVTYIINADGVLVKMESPNLASSNKYNSFESVDSTDPMLSTEIGGCLKEIENNESLKILDDVPIQPGTYTINAYGVLELESSPNIVTPNNNNSLPSIDFPFQNMSTNISTTENNILFKASIPATTGNTNHENSQQSIAKDDSFNLKPVSSSSLTGPNSLIKKISTSMSPNFEKHLYYPKPSTSAQSKLKIKTPSAISALAWRQHIQSKEDEKLAKAEGVKKRKLERQRIKQEKENRPMKSKKRKQLTISVSDNLNTDADNDYLT